MLRWLAIALLLCAGQARADDFPSHPITMFVPFPAGGPTDTVARLVAQAMGTALKQQVLVENVGGAGGTLGAGRAARAGGGGYTLLLHHIGQATAPALYRKLAYDPVADFEPVGLITDVPMTLIARRDFPARNLAELLAQIRTSKDKITYANAGLGSASHLCGVLLMSAIQTTMTTVPYKGTGPAMNDLLGGQVDLLCDQTTNTTSQIRAGKVKAYGVTTKARLTSLPDLPTFAEGGLPNFEITIWHGLYAGKGTPRPVVEVLARALRAALADPVVKRRFADLGTAPVSADRATPEALRTQLAAEIARWRPILQKAGAYAD
jgi:tripartite-type tricarboxylate transporter receptor subunit TctC